MNRLTRGLAATFVLVLAGAPAAMAQEPATDGGTSPTTTESAPATTESAPATGEPATAPAAAYPATKTITLTRSEVKRVQRRVRVRPDGALGSRTRAAIRRYQGQRELKRTGRPNLETIRRMKMPFVAEVERRLSGLGTRSATRTPAEAAPAGDLSAVVEAARAAIGTPYGSGGDGPGSYDCSGLTVHAFRAAGITLPRTSFDQYAEGTAVARDAIQAGDLVFFSTNGAGASHVGVATGPTTVISATTKGVMEHRSDDDYWGAHYVGARRVAAAG